MDKVKSKLAARLDLVHPKLKFPVDRRALNAHKVYNPSFESENFISEDGRTVYGEWFKFPSSEEEINEVPQLKELALMVYCKSNKGPLDDRLGPYELVIFGETSDIECPLHDCVNLDNEIYWKGVADAKCKNRHKFLSACNDTNYCWRNLGIQTKLEEIIETTEYKLWNPNYFEDIIPRVAPFIENLVIRQMQPMISTTHLEEDTGNRVLNCPTAECHHGSLSFLKNLSYLVELSITFGLETCLGNYENRYFDFSYEDVKNLAIGIAPLVSLEIFRMRSSRMNVQKTKILMDGMDKLKIKVLEFSYCDLNDDSMQSIAMYLTINSCLHDLELRGNFVGIQGCRLLGWAIKNFKGNLVYLGLSKNPLLEDGLLAIGAGFLYTPHVVKLDLSLCDLGPTLGPLRACQIIGFHKILEEYNMSNIVVGPEGGEKIIKNLTDHTQLHKFDVRSCGLTIDQEIEVSILMERNMYLRKNSCFKKDHVAEEDVIEIEECIKQLKHPLCSKLAARVDSIESFNVLTRKSIYDHEIYSSFIEEEDRRPKSNSELFGFDFEECFRVNDVLLLRCASPHFICEESPVESKPFIPNDFDEHEFIHAVRKHQSERNCRNYFE